MTSSEQFGEQWLTCMEIDCGGLKVIAIYAEEGQRMIGGVLRRPGVGRGMFIQRGWRMCATGEREAYCIDRATKKEP